jgi:hypothetical protein
LRPSSVELARRSALSINHQVPIDFADILLDGERFPAEAASSFHEHNLRNITVTTMQEPELNVDEELAYVDEYADIAVRLRKKPGEKEKKKVKKLVKASALCEKRDKVFRVNFDLL